MCKCSGASEHDHITPVTVSKSLHSYIVMERSSVLNARNPQILHDQILREKYFSEVSGAVGLESECDDQLLVNIA